MQVSSLSQNNINYRGFKTDYKALQRQYCKARFFHYNNQNATNFDLMRKSENAFERFCRSNPIRSALMMLPEVFNKPFNKKYVTRDKELLDKLKDEYAMALAKSYFQGMKRIGLGKADSIKYLEEVGE